MPAPEIHASILFPKDATANHIAVPVTQSDDPKGDGVLVIGPGDHRKISLTFFGKGPIGAGAVAWIVGWRMLPGHNDPLWIPVPFANLNLTFGPVNGVKRTPISIEHRFVSEIAISRVFVNELEVNSPATNRIAEVRFDHRDCHRIQVLLATSPEQTVNAIAHRCQ